MNLLESLIFILAGMLIALAFSSYAAFLRTRRPERYKGVWRWWGDMTQPVWRATLPFIGMMIGALIISGVQAFLHPGETQRLALQINALFLLVTFLAIVFSITLHQLRRK